MYAADLTAGIVHHDAAVRVHHIAAGLPVEGGNFQRVHKVAVVKADGDGLVGEPLINAGVGGHHKHHDFRLVGNDRGDHRVLPVQHDLRQMVFQIQIALLALGGAVLALAGDEVEIREPAFLFQNLHIFLNPRIVLHIPQVGHPHLHGAPVMGHQIVQGLVCLMINLRQVGGAFLKNHFGYIIVVPHARGQNRRGQRQNDGNGKQMFTHGWVPFPVSRLLSMVPRARHSRCPSSAAWHGTWPDRPGQ